MIARLSTITGAKIGFEFFTKQDFEDAEIDRKFGLMIDLFCIRIDMSW